jgi:hypothetical protein
VPGVQQDSEARGIHDSDGGKVDDEVVWATPDQMLEASPYLGGGEQVKLSRDRDQTRIVDYSLMEAEVAGAARHIAEVLSTVGRAAEE